MNNNNNNVSCTVNDTLFVVSLKALVRDVVREELVLQGIPVDSNVPRMVARQPQTFENMQKPNTNYDTRNVGETYLQRGVLNKTDIKMNSKPWYENIIDNEYYSSNEFGLYPDSEHSSESCNNIIADVKAKKYEAFKKLGFFDLMPNGFNLYLDDEDIVEDDDSTQALLNYDFSNDCYTLISNSAIKITRDDLLKCTITGIGSDISDFSVPAVWIKPDENWYKKREQYSRLTSALINVTNKKYAIEKALMKADAADNAKPKRQYKRRRSVNK